MKHLILILITCLSFSCSAQSQQEVNSINVLFIGNSLTYYHEMPLTVQKMLNETDSNIHIEQISFPGLSLHGHIHSIVTLDSGNYIETRAKNQNEVSKTQLKIEEKDWDIIILQDGGVRYLIPEARKYKILPAIAEIKTLITNPKCKVILFKTWPSKTEYPQNYCMPTSWINNALEQEKYCAPTINNLKEGMDLLDESFELVSTHTGLNVSENGNKFYEVLLKYPEINLYDDKSHPNANGAYLNACVFYKLLTNKKVSKLKYIGEINPKIAKKLKKIVD